MHRVQEEYTMVGQNAATKKVGRIGRILFSMPMVAKAGRMTGVDARSMSGAEKRDHSRSNALVMRVDTRAPKHEYLEQELLRARTPWWAQ